jgi:hypothetical protein
MGAPPENSSAAAITQARANFSRAGGAIVRTTRIIPAPISGLTSGRMRIVALSSVFAGFTRPARIARRRGNPVSNRRVMLRAAPQLATPPL